MDERGVTNLEWLQRMAQNDPNALDEWFKAERETNGIGGETNAIHADATLVDGLPEGDAVDMLRKYANFWSLSHETRTQCDSNWEKTTMLALADMLERDYVLRSIFDAVCDNRDEWKAKAESAVHDNPYVGLVRGKQWERTEISDYYCGRCGWKVTDHDSYCPECGGKLHGGSSKVRAGSSNLEWYFEHDDEFHVAVEACEGCDLVDEWKAKASELAASVKNYIHVGDLQRKENWELQSEIRRQGGVIDSLNAKLKAEGSSKVRAGQSNLEWLVFESSFGGQCVMAMYSELHHLPKTPWNSFAEFNNWLLAPHDDAHSTTENLSEQPESLSDANDDLSPENDARANDVDANDGNATQDSREKLEADVHRYANPTNCIGSLGDCWEKKMIGFLDRQKDITERELCKQCEWPSLAAQPDKEAYDRIEALQWDNAKVARELWSAMAERDQWRSICGALMDAADEIRLIADTQMPRGGFDAVKAVDA